jgi:KipI family sensor histidine kinase inhibitor
MANTRYKEPRLLAGGDKALFVEFGDTIDPELNRRVRQLRLAIEKERIPGITETVPTYRSLLVYFEPRQISPDRLRKILYELAQQPEKEELPEPSLIEIPTTYGGEYGPDLEFVAAHNNLSTSEVVRVHTGTPYLVYMLGFMPGFPYLGGMSPRISAPRLETPRTRIPAGSVGIAGNQTGIYPADSPGGWRLIGRTPLELFNPGREPAALIQAGNYLIFVSITPEEFNSIRQAVEKKTYSVKVTVMKREEHGYL